MHVVAGTRAAEILGTAPRTERYFCSYGLDQRYLNALRAGGLVVAGRDESGEVRLAELPQLRFFMGSLFQPELSSTRAWIHPLIAAFAAAVRGQPGPSSPWVSPGAELPGTRVSAR